MESDDPRTQRLAFCVLAVLAFVACAWAWWCERPYGLMLVAAMGVAAVALGWLALRASLRAPPPESAAV